MATHHLRAHQVPQEDAQENPRGAPRMPMEAPKEPMDPALIPGEYTSGRLGFADTTSGPMESPSGPMLSGIENTKIIYYQAKTDTMPDSDTS